MNWLKEQNRRTSQLVRGDFSSQLWMTAVAFAALVVLGFILGFVLEDFAAQFVSYFTNSIADSGVMDEDGTIHLLPLLYNNLRAAAFTILYGFIPFIFLPALSLGINALLIGAFAAYYLANGMSMLYFFAGIIPHGIFEFPALIISIALGLYLCQAVNDYTRHNTKGSVKACLIGIARVYCLRALPLFTVASLIECYITPLIVSFISPTA